MTEQPGPKIPARVAAAENGAYLPPAYELADVSAFQSLARGEANPDQQRRVLKWLLERGCALYDLSYRPGGEDGRRDTDFCEGRRFVGLQVVKLTRLNLAALKHDEPRSDPHEPRS